MVETVDLKMAFLVKFTASEYERLEVQASGLRTTVADYIHQVVMAKLDEIADA